jgi:hypothetical protein
METITGIFSSSSGVHRATRRLETSLGRDRITLLVPGEAQNAEGAVAAVAAEQPGVGKALGGVAGAAVGFAGGVELAAATTALIPGVGPVIAFGILGGALLGYLGAKVGQAADRATSEGLPEDELFVYEDALRRGRSVLITSVEDKASADWVRKTLADEGAESIDAAREMWWIGLRSAEKEHYAEGGESDRNEKFYRLGYEAALHAKYRCKEYDQILTEMQADLEEVKKRYPGGDVEKPFLKGFERGRAFYQEICEKTPVETARQKANTSLP